jgi:hypothetical protein
MTLSEILILLVLPVVAGACVAAVQPRRAVVYWGGFAVLMVIELVGLTQWASWRTASFFVPPLLLAFAVPRIIPQLRAMPAAAGICGAAVYFVTLLIQVSVLVTLGVISP